MPGESIREHVRLTTQAQRETGEPRAHILQISEMMDANNTVMFSSDYPHRDFDDPKMALPPLPGELRERIVRRNPAGLYHLGGKGS